MSATNGNGTVEGELVDAQVVDHDTPGQALIPAVPTPALAVTPQVQATELVERLSVIRDAMTSAMKDGIDYGRIPGVDKPTLLKPGAEKLGVLFQLDVQLDNRKTWGPGEHLTVESHATVFHAPTGARLGYGEGLCTTRERKYAKRRQERTCPTCGAAAVIKGKAEYGGGWLCWKKRDGCNAKFRDGDPAIEGQEVGEVENPDLPDLWNTVLKMAEKRARVDAVLAVTGASALFTQDAEDMRGHGQPSDEEPSAPPRAATPALPEVVVTELAAMAKQLVAAKVWDARQLTTEFIAAGAQDTSSIEGALRTLTPQSAETLKSNMADLLAAAEAKA